jgi:trehalose 6-phosphate synthase/phosphatase
LIKYNYCVIEGGRVKLFEKRDKRTLQPKDFDTEIVDDCPIETFVETPSEENDMSLPAQLRKRAESYCEQPDVLSFFKRVILVCYHLPIEIARTNDPKSPFRITWAESLIAKSGSGSISGPLDVYWVGTMPHVSNLTTDENDILRQQLKEMKCIPIFFDERIVQDAYYGYCKQVLWPLFHNVDQLDHLHAAWNFPSTAPSAGNLSPFMTSPPSSSGSGSSATGIASGITNTINGNNGGETETIVCWEQNPVYWPSYVAMNEAFIPLLQEMVQPGDVVWIHDYHLSLLPGLIREKLKDVWTVYFSHIPFPTSQV